MMWSSLLIELDAHRPGTVADESVPLPTSPVPVTVLTGFLGAGKSTLLAQLLMRPPGGLTVRAVVNDVGSLPFDPTLVEAANEVEVELANGCGCCERTADLGATLDRLAGSAAPRPGVDLIVLEASGVADPLALAQVVEARRALTLDRIVTAVDGQALDRQLATPGLAPIVVRQLDAAHCVVITHADRLSAPDLQRAVTTVAAAAPGRVLTTSSIAAPAAELLTPTAVRGARLMPATDGPAHQLVAVTVTQAGPLTRAELERALAYRPPGIVRAKGRLRIDDDYVHLQLTPSSCTLTIVDEGECGCTIVATNRLDAEALAAMLR